MTAFWETAFVDKQMWGSEPSGRASERMTVEVALERVEVIDPKYA